MLYNVVNQVWWHQVRLSWSLWKPASVSLHHWMTDVLKSMGESQLFLLPHRHHEMVTRQHDASSCFGCTMADLLSSCCDLTHIFMEESIMWTAVNSEGSFCGWCPYSMTLWCQSLLQNVKFTQKKKKPVTSSVSDKGLAVFEFVIVHHLITMCFLKTADTETLCGFIQTWAQDFWLSLCCFLPPEPSRFLRPIWWRRSAADRLCEQTAADTRCGAFGHVLFTSVLFTTH